MRGAFSKLESGQFSDALSAVEQALQLFGILDIMWHSFNCKRKIERSKRETKRGSYMWSLQTCIKTVNCTYSSRCEKECHFNYISRESCTPAKAQNCLL